MRISRYVLAAFAFAIVIPLVVDATIQTQHSLATVNVTINVTPAPVAFRAGPRSSDARGKGITAHFSLNVHELPSNYANAQSLTFVPGNLVAQSANQQKTIKVEAEVSPNPNATLLYASQTGVSINAVAGTTVTVSCIYTITAHTTQTSWTVKQGLYTDLTDPSTNLSFPGGDLKNNTYIATPNPAATAFAVYSTDGGQWSVLAVNGGIKSWCVDLTVIVPASVAQGNYSSNAFYTIWY